MRLSADNLSNLSGWMGRGTVLGRLAVLEGLIDDRTLRECLREAHDDRTLADVLVARGVTAAQVAGLLHEQALIDAGARLGVVEPVRTLGRFALVERIGYGGAGTVWKAWDLRLERWIALKEFSIERPYAKERIIREARAAARVRHESLVQVHEVGEQDGAPYMVMELVDGRTLDETSASPRRAAELVAAVCEAVQALHDRGILHRDVKPANVIVDASGRPHLADFSLARCEGDPAMTRDGAVVGTPLFMAPEQAAGGKPDARTDVYGLGATLYRLLVGRPPHEAADPVARIEAVVPSVPEPLCRIVRRAMARDLDHRYQTPRAMADDLRRWLRGERVSDTPRFTPALRRATRRAWIVPALVVATVAMAIVMAGRRTRDSDARALVAEAHALLDDSVAARYHRVEDLRGRMAALTRRPADLLHRACELAPDDWEPRAAQGRLMLLRGDAEEAVLAYDEAIARRAPSPVRLARAEALLSAHAHALLDEPAPALPRVRADLAALAEQNDVARGLLALAEGDATAATAAMERALITAGGRRREDLLYYLGIARVRAGDDAEAERSFSRAIELCVNHESAYAARSRVRTRMCKHAAALQDVDETLRISPGRPWARLARAELLVRHLRTDADDAVATCEDLAAALPSPGVSARRIAAVLHHASAVVAPERRTATLRRAIELYDRESAHPLIDRAWACWELSAETKDDALAARAIADFEEAARLEPSNHNVHTHLGDVFKTKRRLDEAVGSYSRSIDLTPEGDDRYRVVKALRHSYRADAYRLLGRHRDAIRDLTCAIEILSCCSADALEAPRTRRDHARLLASRAALHVLADDPAAALDDARRAIEIDGQLAAPLQPLVDECRRRIR